MTDWLEAALEISIDASALLNDRFTRLLEVEGKGSFDMVTEADRSCERLIAERLVRCFPDHSIVGEEGANHRGNSDYCWYVDPLDGTANFVHRFPFFAVSIALVRGGAPILGVISDPVRNEHFAAGAGVGTQLNGVPVKVSSVSRISDSLLGTVFPVQVRASTGNIHYYQQLDCNSHGVRRTGSAALDLAYVACGRLDALWGFGLKPWDFAAGLLLAQEAGGTATDMLGGPVSIDSKHLLVDNCLLHGQLLSVFRDVSDERMPQVPSPRIC